MKPCNLHIAATLKLTEEMIRLADLGETDREDNGCGILYGVLRDSAFKLRKLLSHLLDIRPFRREFNQQLLALLTQIGDLLAQLLNHRGER